MTRHNSLPSLYSAHYINSTLFSWRTNKIYIYNDDGRKRIEFDKWENFSNYSHKLLFASCVKSLTNRNSKSDLFIITTVLGHAFYKRIRIQYSIKYLNWNVPNNTIDIDVNKYTFTSLWKQTVYCLCEVK